MEVEVTAATLADLQAHARETYPDECCGFVVQEHGRTRVLRMDNVQNELHAKDPEQFPRTAATAYTMRYRDVEPLFEAAYKNEIRLLAVYHSHPEHDAYFSEQDRSAAAGWVDDPNYASAGQLVMSVRGGQVVDTKAFAWDESRREYVGATLTVAG